MWKKIQSSKISITQSDVDKFKSSKYSNLSNDKKDYMIGYLTRHVENELYCDYKNLAPHKWEALMEILRRELPIGSDMTYIVSRKLANDVNNYGINYKGTYTVHVFKRELCI